MGWIWFVWLVCTSTIGTCRQIYNEIEIVIEYLGNSLTQTKQKFLRFYILDCWIQIVQFDKQNKRLTKCTLIQIVQFYELLYGLFGFVRNSQKIQNVFQVFFFLSRILLQFPFQLYAWQSTLNNLKYIPLILAI